MDREPLEHLIRQIVKQEIEDYVKKLEEDITKLKKDSHAHVRELHNLFG